VRNEKRETSFLFSSSIIEFFTVAAIRARTSLATISKARIHVVIAKVSHLMAFSWKINFFVSCEILEGFEEISD
jgi:hypothetical protein